MKLMLILGEYAVSVDRADRSGTNRREQLLRRRLIVFEVPADAVANLGQLLRYHSTHILLNDLTRCVLVSLDDARQVAVLVGLNGIQLTLQVGAQTRLLLPCTHVLPLI